MEPEIRAPLLKLYLDQLSTLGREEAAAVRAELGPALHRIERARAFEWLPVTLEVDILHALHRRRGDPGVRAFCRGLGRAAMDYVVFKPLFSAAVFMRGRRPEWLLSVAQRAWGVAARHAGRVTTQMSGPDGARVLLSELPPVMRDRVFLLRPCAMIESLLEFGGHAAHADVDWTAGADVAVLSVAWRPASSHG